MVSKKQALLSGWQGMPSAGGLQNPGGGNHRPGDSAEACPGMQSTWGFPGP